MGENIQLRAVDGFTLGAYQALPAGKPRGAVVVIQEIFGVNAHIREVADGYASDGYAAIAPQIFDRVRRDVELGYGPADMTQGIELAMKQSKRANILSDVQAAIDSASRFGKVGVVGYCFGGLMTWLAACELSGVACASSYYGGGIAQELERTPKCPIVLHFGERDAFIPMDQVDSVRHKHPTVPVHVYAADHGFNCGHRASHDANAATLARTRTLELFKQHIG